MGRVKELIENEYTEYFNEVYMYYLEQEALYENKQNTTR